jgi:carbonic anhydrase/acetyltransferase-like protein (isoleucine patch superfamily)
MQDKCYMQDFMTHLVTKGQITSLKISNYQVVIKHHQHNVTHSIIIHGCECLWYVVSGMQVAVVNVVCDAATLVKYCKCAPLNGGKSVPF